MVDKWTSRTTAVDRRPSKTALLTRLNTHTHTQTQWIFQISRHFDFTLVHPTSMAHWAAHANVLDTCPLLPLTVFPGRFLLSVIWNSTSLCLLKSPWSLQNLQLVTRGHALCVTQPNQWSVLILRRPSNFGCTILLLT